jgi:hypothetical protein
MAELEGQDPGGAGLVFTAHNNHTPHCGLPPRVRNIDNPGLYFGYFENLLGEQFVFVFDQATKTGKVSGGDLDWGKPKTFTLGLLEEALRATQRLAEQIMRQASAETPRLPIIDAALALGRLTGLTGKDEIIWLRACLNACVPPPELPE